MHGRIECSGRHVPTGAVVALADSAADLALGEHYEEARQSSALDCHTGPARQMLSHCPSAGLAIQGIDEYTLGNSPN